MYCKILAFVALISSACGPSWSPSHQNDGGTSAATNSTQPDGKYCSATLSCGSRELVCMSGSCVAAPTSCDAAHACAHGYACKQGSCEFVPPARVPSSSSLGSGVTTARSFTHVLRAASGIAGPVGVASSKTYRLTVGPQAGR